MIGTPLLLSLLGGALALDQTSVGQVMFSRPLVAGTLAGWLLGRPLEGFFVGGILEIYLLVSFPVGGARFPEAGPATVVAAAVATSTDLVGGLALGVVLGLVWGQVGGVTVTWLRTINVRVAPDPDSGRVTAAGVTARHLAAVGLDFVRGALLTVTGLLVGTALLPLARLWPMGAPDTRGFLLIGAAVSMGILLRSFGGLRRRGLLFAGGLCAGVLGGILL